MFSAMNNELELQIVHIFFDTATFDKVKKLKQLVVKNPFSRLSGM